MKKIIILLFLFFLCYMCFYIYNITENKNPYILSIGDNISNIYLINDNPYIEEYNTIYTNKDYRTIDLLNIIKYNEEQEINNEAISIHRLLKKTDILIISIGMNDIYYKLNDNTKEIYTYLNNIINNYEEILKEISKYDYQEVYVLGYYNITNKQNDIFDYINYKLKQLAIKYHYTYLDLNKIFYNNEKYLIKPTNYYLNNNGYCKIYELIVEKIKKSWYNIKRIYYYDLY